MQARLLWGMLFCLAVSVLHTKLAGLAWLLLLVAAAFSARGPLHGGHSDVTRASHHWTAGVAFFLAVVVALAVIWPAGDSLASSDMNTGFRLLTAALATLVLVKRTGPLQMPIEHANTAVAVALALGFLLVVAVDRALPSHPVPWAVSMAVWVAFLLPHSMDKETSKHRSLAYAGAVMLGIFGVLLSQSRGAYAIVFWPLILLVANSRGLNHQALLRVGWLGALSMCLLAMSVLLPADPLRLRLAWNEVETALETKDFNSSLGARVYLFQTGWDGFVESPWVGVGAAERTRRLQSAGLQLPPAKTERFSHVRTLGHVHNQYLHQAMDGGLLGLSGLLAILAGMIAAAWRLRRAHKIASQQLAGIAFVHATASLSNVNFAHNYYVLMLGLSISVVFLQAATKTETDKSLTQTPLYRQ